MELVPSLSQNSINPLPILSHSSCPPSSSRLFSSISSCILAIQDRLTLHKLQSRLERVRYTVGDAQVDYKKVGLNVRPSKRVVLADRCRTALSRRRTEPDLFL